MEVTGSQTRRQQSATSQTSENQNSATRTAEYQLTELKNVPPRSGKAVTNEFEQSEKVFPTIESSISQKAALNTTSSESQSRGVVDKDFQLRLINAVRENPCLYDPLNEFYRGKPDHNKIRLRAWERIAEQLNWRPNLDSLIDEWECLRDTYIRKKTEQRTDASDQLCSAGGFLFESMQWIDEYIFEEAPQSDITLSPTNAQDVYFNEVNQDVMISGYQQPQTLASHRRLPQSESQSGGYQILLRQSSPNGGQTTTIRVVSGSSNGAENAARNTTVPVNTSKAMTGVATSNARSQCLHIVHVPQSSSSQFIQKVGHEGVTVTAAGNAGMVGNVKKDAMTMVVDPTPYYTDGAQKMYRLVNVSDIDSHVNHPPSRKRIAIVPKSTGQPSQQNASISSQSSPLSMTSGGNPISGGGQLGDDIIIDDGIEERTVVIEQHDSDSPLLGDSPLSTMMVSGHQAVPRGSTHQPRHIQIAMVDHLRSQTRVVSPQHHSPPLGSGYLQQSQYDADLQFQQYISQNLSVLNEDEKCVAKMNIQKILVDARFGLGTCLRLMHEEEMAAQNAGRPSGSRDGSRSLDM